MPSRGSSLLTQKSCLDIPAVGTRSMANAGKASCQCLVGQTDKGECTDPGNVTSDNEEFLCLFGLGGDFYFRNKVISRSGKSLGSDSNVDFRE